MLVFDSKLQSINFPYIFILWGLGIINVTLNAIYVDKIKLKNWVLTLLIISGLTWAFRPYYLLFLVYPSY